MVSQTFKNSLNYKPKSNTGFETANTHPQARVPDKDGYCYFIILLFQNFTDGTSSGVALPGRLRSQKLNNQLFSIRGMFIRTLKSDSVTYNYYMYQFLSIYHNFNKKILLEQMGKSLFSISYAICGVYRQSQQCVIYYKPASSRRI